MTGTVYLYVCDTMADWEIGNLTAELNTGRFFKKGVAPYKIVTVGTDVTPVTTMGGLKILPDINVAGCDIKSADALILPGSETWLDSIHDPIINKAKQCMKENVIVAAICGATMGLAKNGLLDSRYHTSNDLGYLKMVCPDYKGEAYYKNEPAVTDGNLITATGVAPLEFTVEVLRALAVFSPETLDVWYKLFKTHQSEYFFELMNAVQ